MAHRRKNKQQQKQQKQSTQNTANFRQRNGGGGSASNTAFFLKKETGKRKKYRRRNTMHKVGREGTWLKQGVHPFLPCQKKKKTLLQYLGAPPLLSIVFHSLPHLHALLLPHLQMRHPPNHSLLHPPPRSLLPRHIQDREKKQKNKKIFAG